MERAKGLDGNNFVTVAMRDKGMSIQEAADYTGAEFMERLSQFLEDRKELPSLGRMWTRMSKNMSTPSRNGVSET